jgi:hypothetical protein
VTALTIVTAAARRFIRFSPEQISAMATQEKLFHVHTPGFLIAYNLFVIASLVGIYATRRIERWHSWRVRFYTMLLAGFLIQLVALALPIH